MTRRLVMAVLSAAAVAACGGSASSSSSSASTPAPTPQTVTFTETEFKIDTAATGLKAGSYVFQISNGGKFPHDLHILTSDGSEVAHSDQLPAGQSGSFQVDLKPGTYTYFCGVGNHRQRGMEGKLTVQ